MKKISMAFVHYLFAAVFAFTYFLSFNIGGEFGDRLFWLFILCVPAWVLLIIADLFLYRKLPSFIVLIVPFFIGISGQFTKPAIFYVFMKPDFDLVINEVMQNARICTEPNNEMKDLVQCIEEKRTKFGYAYGWGIVHKISNKSGNDAIVINFSVSHTGGRLGSHWGYVYSSVGQEIKLESLSKIIGGDLSKMNDNWYSWSD